MLKTRRHIVEKHYFFTRVKESVSNVCIRANGAKWAQRYLLLATQTVDLLKSTQSDLYYHVFREENMFSSQDFLSILTANWR